MTYRSRLLTLSALLTCCFASTSMAWSGWKDHVNVSGAFITHLSYDGGIVAGSTGSSSFTINAAQTGTCTTGVFGQTYCDSGDDGHVYLNLSNGIDTCSVTLLEGSWMWNAEIISSQCHGNFSGVSLSHSGYYYVLSVLS